MKCPWCSPADGIHFCGVARCCAWSVCAPTPVKAPPLRLRLFLRLSLWRACTVHLSSIWRERPRWLRQLRWTDAKALARSGAQMQQRSERLWAAGGRGNLTPQDTVVLGSQRNSSLVDPPGRARWRLMPGGSGTSSAKRRLANLPSSPGWERVPCLYLLPPKTGSQGTEGRGN